MSNLMKKFTPEEVGILVNRAQAFRKMQNFAAASKDCETVMVHDPFHEKANYILGISRVELGKEDTEH